MKDAIRFWGPVYALILPVLLLPMALNLACKAPTGPKLRTLGETPCPCPTETPTPFVAWDDRGIPGPSPTPQRCYTTTGAVQASWAPGYDLLPSDHCGSFLLDPPPTKTPTWPSTPTVTP